MLNFTEKAPMGWNSWDCWGAAVNEDTVRKNAEFISKSLKKYGWEYVVVDIQWSAANAKNHEYEPFAELCMDEYSRLIPAENRFPSSAGGKGFAPLADYVHSLGLKFGIHIMRGIPRQAVHRNTKILHSERTAREIAKTDSICQWNTDMYGVDPAKDGAKAYYDSIFRLYAKWGVDFVKCDDIAREFPHAESELIMLSKALQDCPIEMVLSLSPGPAPLEKAELFKQISNMWRITDDFWDKWELLYAMFERCEKWCTHTGAGHWPDADMLPLGALRQDYNPDDRTRFTKAEQRTMMTLWCMMQSPLMIGSEMTKLDDFTLGLLTNAAVLEIEKASWCGHPLCTTDEMSAWLAPRTDGKGAYVALFNLSDEARELELDAEHIGYDFTEAIELWSGEKCSGVKAALEAHDARVWLIK